MTYCEGGVAAVASYGFPRENRDGDGDADLQDEQNQEEAQRSVHRRLKRTDRRSSALQELQRNKLLIIFHNHVNLSAGLVNICVCHLTY